MEQRPAPTPFDSPPRIALRPLSRTEFLDGTKAMGAPVTADTSCLGRLQPANNDGALQGPMVLDGGSQTPSRQAPDTAKGGNNAVAQPAGGSHAIR